MATQGSQKLRALPVQFIEVPGGVIVKRGRAEIKIGGERAAEVVRSVLSAAVAAASSDEICCAFAAPDREAVRELISKFEARRILVPVKNGDLPPEVPEANLDIFYWHFGSRGLQVSERLSSQRITIVGVNCISRRLAAALAVDGARNMEVVHYPLLCNLRLLDDDGEVQPEEWPEPLPRPRDYSDWLEELDPESLGCLVATSDFGGLHLMRVWNEFCVRKKRHFLPVVLQDLIGYIGPLVVPRETACFECLRARQNSHLAEPEIQRAAEPHSFTLQAVTGFHPSMASVLGDLAAMELSRFYGGWAPPRAVGTLIEVNLVAPELTARSVLKVPRCRVCSEQTQRTGSSPYRSVFMSDAEWAP
jgi:bacteriocin biosynthesis cyclodehydratase domain-containing protein